jgi:hypothetical protein
LARKDNASAYLLQPKLKFYDSLGQLHQKSPNEKIHSGFSIPASTGILCAFTEA